MSAPAPPESVLHLETGDGCAIAGLQVGDPDRASHVLVVAGAMGVPCRFYAPLARHFAHSGSLVLLFDYRGIGGSAPARLRGFRARARDWAQHDLGGALAHAAMQWPHLPLAVLGHSFGGQVVGLAPGADRVAALLLVASQSGHWRHWSGAARLGMWALWHLAIPGLVPLLGRLPGRLLGGGEDVPAGVALEWARWGRHRGYLFDPDIGHDLAGYQRLAVPLRCIGFSDDGFAPRVATEALLAQYPMARIEHQHLHPADLGLTSVGHFGFFRPRAQALWEDCVRWLAQSLSPSTLPT